MWCRLAIVVLLGLSTTARSWNVTWTKAAPGQTCMEACPLGCLEDGSHYPTISGKMDKILHEVHAGCTAFVAEGCQHKQRYNLSAAHALHEYLAEEKEHCSEGATSSPRFYPSINSAGRCTLHLWADAGMCSMKPPVATSRICPCAPYDCVAGLANWQEGWSEVKQDWCCQNAKVGCRDKTHAAAAPHEPYDCRTKTEDWSEVWSLGAHTWCCSKEGYGCLEISSVSGGTARFAHGSMELSVAPEKFFSDPLVSAAIQRGIASMAGVDAGTVGMLLRSQDPSPEEVQEGSRNLRETARARRLAGSLRALVNFTVPVPAAHGGIGNSGPIALASASATVWEKVLQKFLAPVGDYLVSVDDVGEVSLQRAEPPLNLKPKPLHHSHVKKAAPVHVITEEAKTEPTGRTFALAAGALFLGWVTFFVTMAKVHARAPEIKMNPSSSALMEEPEPLQSFRHEAFEPIKEKVLQAEPELEPEEDFSPIKKRVQEDSEPAEPTTSARPEEPKKGRCGPCAPCVAKCAPVCAKTPCGGGGRGASEPGQTPARPTHA